MTAAVLVAGVAGISPVLSAADAPDAVSKLLADARTNAAQISSDWKTYARQPNLKWAGDAVEISRMRDDINAAAKTIASLNDSRTQASPSQAASIDRILPVMEEIADTATNAIAFLNKNQTRLSGKEYKAYLDANSDTYSRLAGLVAQIVEIGNNRDRFENAKRALQLASK